MYEYTAQQHDQNPQNEPVHESTVDVLQRALETIRHRL